MKIFVALGAAITMTVSMVGEPASAITVELAKKCRDLALKTYPYKLVGEPGPATAQAQRSYYSQCVAKQGNMPPEPPGAGQDKSGQTPPK